MKILYAAPITGHTKKFCDYFAGKGHDIHVISFSGNTVIDSAEVRTIDTGVSGYDSDMRKLYYMKAVKFFRQAALEIKPDILHVHYVSSYGGVMAMTGIKHYILSMWGDDVVAVPKRSFIHRKCVEFALAKADMLMSTSQAMADVAQKYTRKKIYITPFGIKMDLFSRNKSQRLYNDGQFIIGCVKGLDPQYGIEYLIRAARIIKDKRPDINLKVRIAGKGILEGQLKTLTEELQLSDVISFLGHISQQEAAKEWAQADISVIPSESESFGVSAVEAQACESPVIISDIPGLMEATSPGYSSIVVPRKNAEAIAEAVIKLYDNEELRYTLGRNGRKFVQERYELNHCFSYIESLYYDFLKGRH